MRDTIESIYADMLRSEQEENKLFKDIVRAIESVADRRKVKVRADGLYFLARNLEELIVRPAQRATEQELVEEPDLPHIIYHDTEFLFEGIYRRLELMNDKPLSSTEILFFFAEHLNSMEISRMTIWGDEEEKHNVRG